MTHPREAEEFLRVPAPGSHPDQAHARRVVLDLMAGLAWAPLVNHQDMPETPEWYAGGLISVDNPGDVVELDRPDASFYVLTAATWVGRHVDAAVGTARAPDPGTRSPGELAVLILLRVLTEVPQVAAVVLGEQGEFLLLQLPPQEVTVPRDHGRHAADDLGQVSDGEHDAVRLGLAAFHDLPAVDVLGTRRQGEHPVAHLQRCREPGGRGRPRRAWCRRLPGRRAGAG